MGANASREVWLPFHCGDNIPPDTLTVSEGIFIGRKFVDDLGLFLASFDQKDQTAAFINDQKLAFTEEFELLSGRGHAWVSAGHGDLSTHAVAGGLTSNGDTLYIARALCDGKMMPGAVLAEAKSIQIPFKETIVVKHDFEILISLPKGDVEDKSSKQLLDHAAKVLESQGSFTLKKAEYKVEEYPADFDPDDLGIEEMKMNDAATEGKTTCSECSICLESRVDSVYYPCGHMSNCFKCAANEKSRVGICPICRADVRDIVQIFKTY